MPKSKRGKDENTVIEFMLLESATLELMMAIGENDFFGGKQLLVIPGDDKGKFIVHKRYLLLQNNNPEFHKNFDNGNSKLIFNPIYSCLKESTGFFADVLIACQLTVAKAINRAIAPVRIKLFNEIVVR